MNPIVDSLPKQKRQYKKRKSSPRKIFPITKDGIIEMYRANQQMAVIAKRYGISASSVSLVVAESNIPKRDPRLFAKKYEVDENFFAVIDTPSKAQILGFILTDGCINSRNGKAKCLKVTIKDADIEYLHFIREEMKSNHPIKLGHNFGFSKDSVMATLRIANRTIYNDLVKAGCRERKTYDLNFPIIPRSLTADFVRGYFDGDGGLWIARHSNKIRGKDSIRASINCTCEFAKSLQNILKNILGINSYLYKEPGVYSLKIFGNKQVYRFLDWIYRNSKFSMSRKLAFYEKLKTYYEEDLAIREL